MSVDIQPSFQFGQQVPPSIQEEETKWLISPKVGISGLTTAGWEMMWELIFKKFQLRIQKPSYGACTQDHHSIVTITEFL
jgi:hypothetical protein